MTQSEIDTHRQDSIAPRGHLIDGIIVPSVTGKDTDVISPIDGAPFAKVASGAAEDADLCIQSARAAFDDGRWSRQPPAYRKKVMLKWADLVEREAMALTICGVRDNGTEFGMAFKAEAGSAVGTLRYYAEALDKINGEVTPTAPDRLGLVHKEPVGVVGAIVPWNFPLMIGTWKLAPALAAGNSVVLKPPEVAALSLLRLAEIGLDAGLPPGVLNVVTGKGSIVGEAIGLSMDVDVLVFTGSGSVGRRLLNYSAQSNLKRVYLELGGKSPQVVFDDADDLERAAKVAATAMFRNSGQVCIAPSRLLVQESIYNDFSAEVVKFAEELVVGDPLNLQNDIGAVCSAAQLSQNLEFVEIAKSEGASLMTGGQQILKETGGFYMAPTIFKDVAVKDTLFQKEVFGPVLAVTPFKDDEDALYKCNATEFGLSSAVWTSNLSRAHRMVSSINAGIVHVNTYGGADNTIPLGGHKQSGNGHDKSMHAFEKYLNLKSAWIEV